MLQFPMNAKLSIKSVHLKISHQDASEYPLPTKAYFLSMILTAETSPVFLLVPFLTAMDRNRQRHHTGKGSLTEEALIVDVVVVLDRSAEAIAASVLQLEHRQIPGTRTSTFDNIGSMSSVGERTGASLP